MPRSLLRGPPLYPRGQGDATVLLSLEDVPVERGALGLAPGSHAHYGLDKASAAASDSEPVLDDAARAAAWPRIAWYAYRAGCPCVIDARTLHAASDNRTAGLRAVAWYIYSADEGPADEQSESA